MTRPRLRFLTRQEKKKMSETALGDALSKLRDKLSRIGITEEEFIVLLSGCSERLLIEMIANCREIEMFIKVMGGDWQ